MQLFLRSTLGFNCIPVDLVSKSGGLGYRSAKSRIVRSTPVHTIEELLVFRTRLPLLQRKDAGLAQIIQIKELPEGGCWFPNRSRWPHRAHRTSWKRRIRAGNTWLLVGL